MKKFLIILCSVMVLSCGTSKNSVASGERDGSSFEKAIVVKSVDEEYQYARKHCQGCSFKGQALLYNNKKPYDLLTFTKPDGNKVEYYFDISSFFGKW